MPVNWLYINRVTIDPVIWTAITIPYRLSQLCIFNNDENEFLVRQDSADASTETRVGIGMVWKPGEDSPVSTICYVLSVAGTGPLVIQGIRI